MDTVFAVPIAFLASVTVNYFLCILWVFEGSGPKRRAVKIGFLTTSIIGLFLNEGFMLLFRVWFGEDTILFSIFGFAISMYMVNKMLSTILVMTWNFFTKRLMLKK